VRAFLRIYCKTFCASTWHTHTCTHLYTNGSAFFFWVKRDRPKHRLSFFPEFWALWRRQMRGRDVSLASAGAVAPMEDATPGLLSCRCCRGSRCRGCRVAPIPAGRIALPGPRAAGMRSSRNLRACFIVWMNVALRVSCKGKCWIYIIRTWREFIEWKKKSWKNVSDRSLFFMWRGGTS